MLLQIFLMAVEAVLGFFSMMLLARFLMQATRAPYRNPLGHLVIAVTERFLNPLRRIVPNTYGVDILGLLVAWLLQALFLGLAFALTGEMTALTPVSLGALVFVATLETLRLAVYLIIGAVVVAALLSWVNPYSPVAPLFDALSRPFLSPLRRLLPPIGGIDLSPLILLLLLQMLRGVLDWGRLAMVPLLANV